MDLYEVHEEDARSDSTLLHLPQRTKYFMLTPAGGVFLSCLEEGRSTEAANPVPGTL